MKAETRAHLIRQRTHPHQASLKQQEFNERRLSAVQAALRTRPFFIGLKFDLPAAAQNSPIIQQTPEINHDVIVTGAITNSSRRFRYRRYEGELPFIYNGNEQNLNFPLDQFAGQELSVSGFPGVYDFETPIVLPEQQPFTFEVFKADAEPAETVWLVLCGLRVFNANSTEATLSASRLKRINEVIKSRSAPEPRAAISKVTYSNQVAVAYSPKMREPMMLIGVATNLNASKINLKINGEADLSLQQFPIWALASQETNSREQFNRLPAPLFVPEQQQIICELTNSNDGGTTIDPDGEIYWIFQTL